MPRLGVYGAGALCVGLSAYGYVGVYLPRAHRQREDELVTEAEHLGVQRLQQTAALLERRAPRTNAGRVSLFATAVHESAVARVLGHTEQPASEDAMQKLRRVVEDRCGDLTFRERPVGLWESALCFWAYVVYFVAFRVVAPLIHADGAAIGQTSWLKGLAGAMLSNNWLGVRVALHGKQEEEDGAEEADGLRSGEMVVAPRVWLEELAVHSVLPVGAKVVRSQPQPLASEYPSTFGYPVAPEAESLAQGGRRPVIAVGTEKFIDPPGNPHRREAAGASNTLGDVASATFVAKNGAVNNDSESTAQQSSCRVPGPVLESTHTALSRIGGSHRATLHLAVMGVTDPDETEVAVADGYRRLTDELLAQQ